jgi:hypothetical protein
MVKVSIAAPGARNNFAPRNTALSSDDGVLEIE